MIVQAALLRIAAAAEPPVAASFAHLPTYTDIAIAPGGSRFAVRFNIDNVYRLIVYDVTGDQVKAVSAFKESELMSVSWFRWVSATRLLVSIAFNAQREQGFGFIDTEERRLVAFDAKTSTVIGLFKERRGQIPIQIQDRIVSFLPNDPEHIMVQYSRGDPSKPNVYKVNVTKTSGHKRVHTGKKGVLRWSADDDGEIRVGTGMRNDRHPLLTIRQKGEKKWRDFSHRLTTPGVSFDVMSFAPGVNKLYVRSNHEGDPSGLYVFDLMHDRFEELIYKHPIVDIANIDVDDKTSELRSINFVVDEVDTKYISMSAIETAISKLHAQFPGKRISISSISSDGERAVLLIRGSKEAGTYYLYDNVARGLTLLQEQYPDLSGDALGETIATHYSARDGLEIPAFVTAPPGIDSIQQINRLPFVIMPHGGPAARDFLRFDYWVQFLVSRGYGVLQMNFRGSAGYGEAFKQAGNREWGQAMQDDVTDGVRWLVAGEHADPDRIVILGGSYGGYAALIGAAKTPELYRCAVSFAGVSDLPLLIRHARRYIGGRFATRFIGDLWKDRKMLVENSAARRASDITIPVLLFHGTADTVVEIEQSDRMAAALKKHDKEHRYIRLEDGDHYLSIYANRLRFLNETEQFLVACLN